MRIDEILASVTEPVFSFEFFPPKTDEGERNLRRAIEALSPLEPDFVSVTYGAGGSTRARTVELTRWIKQDLGIEAMAHQTCVGASRDELRGVLDGIAAAGIDNVLALRGDPPQGQTQWQPHPQGLRYSNELATLICDGYPFSVGAACFPEIHQESPDLAHDIRFLKRKLESGVSFLITNLFFDNELYFRFVEEAQASGIDVPRRSPACAARPSPTRCSSNSSSAPRIPRRCSSSGSPTRPCSAPSCWRAAPPVSTSTRSTAPPRPERSCRP